jgi:hypothetical protein
MKKAKKKDIMFFAPTLSEKPKGVNIDHVKGLFHYFGYEPTTPEVGGFMGFEHKLFEGNKVIYEQRSGFLCKITFCEPGTGSFATGSQSVCPKTWSGLFTAIKTHTRRLIFIRDLAQSKNKAA